MFFKNKLGSFMGVNESGNVESLLLGQAGVAKRHGDLQPCRQLAVASEASAIVVGSWPPRWRSFIGASSSLAMTICTFLSEQIAAPLEVGLLWINLERWNMVGAEWLFGVHADTTPARQPSDIGRHRNRHLASIGRPNSVHASHKTIQHPIFKRYHTLLTWRPCGIC